METRVYNKKIEISNEDTKEFWNNRANSPINLKTVLLGSDKKMIAQEKRNIKERDILLSYLGEFETLNILDIGCGIGRMVDNLSEKIESYIGINYSKGFIEYAKNKYKAKKNVNFHESSILEIPDEIISKSYDLVICSGVLMYVNDKDLSKVFDIFNYIKTRYIYLQESISLIDGRMTLDKFESADLNTEYSAIYRTKEEYEQYISREIIHTDLLIDNESGARKETNARYWILRG